MAGYLEVQYAPSSQQSKKLPEKFNQFQLRNFLYVMMSASDLPLTILHTPRKDKEFTLSSELSEQSLQILLDNGLGDRSPTDAFQIFTTSRQRAEEEYMVATHSIETNFQSLAGTKRLLLDQAVRQQLVDRALSSYRSVSSLRCTSMVKEYSSPNA